VEPFGRYQLLRKLGSGGMAEVYLARTQLAQGLQKLLVVKTIHPAHAQSPQFHMLFRHEAEAAMNLNHPNIAQVFEWGELPMHYLAMEYVEGVDLMRLSEGAARAGRRFPYGLCAYIVQQMAKGLDYAHRKLDPATGEPLAIVHRDVSPQNVLISYDGAVKLVDFGIAALRGAPEEAGVLKGKFAYMSPEQASARPVDRRSDIYSAGLVLHELVVGRPLPSGSGPAARLVDVPDSQAVDPELPDELARIIATCLASDPNERYQTARDLHKALGRFFFSTGSRDESVYDSSALATFVAQVMPTELRAALPPKPDLETPRTVTSSDAAADTDGAAAQLRERRHVVVVEGELHGFGALRRTYGEDRARAALLDFLRVAEHVAFKHRAHKGRLDDRGFSYLLGLPALRDDDPARAVRLARDLKDALDGISRDLAPPLQLGIGIMLAVAELERRAGAVEYRLLGSAPQVVERLAGEAMAGEILVGGGFYRLARDDWHFDEVEPSASPAGGGRAPRVFRLRAAKRRGERLGARPAPPRARLVGRTRELATLRAALEGALERREPCYLALIGETGLGKRTLVAALLGSLPPGEATILRAQAHPSMSDAPYALASDLVRDFLGLDDLSEPREVRRRIEAALPLFHPGPADEPEARELAGGIGLLLGVHIPGAPAVDDPTERRHRIFRSIERVGAELAAQRPLIVVVEEMHFADPQSLDLLRALIGHPRRSAIIGICTARPDERMRAALADPNIMQQHIVEIGELPPGEREQVLAARFGDDPAARPLVEQILARTGGNPFYMHELVESLVERGIVRADGDRLIWQDQQATLPVPTTVEALVAVRLERLPVPEREAILRAAVLGFRVIPAELAAVLGRDVNAELRALAARGLLDPDGKGAYLFHDQITQELAYRSVPKDERRALHQRAAGLVERRESRHPEAAALLAQHALAAGDRTAAARHTLAAARAAKDVAASLAAFEHLGRARTLLGPEDQVLRFDIASERAEILRLLGRRPGELRELSRMRRAARETASAARHGQALGRLARFEHEIGRAGRALDYAAEALALARQGGDVMTEVQALRTSALVLHGLGKTTEALAHTEAALALCTTAPARANEREWWRERGQVMNARGLILLQTGDYAEAMAAYAEAMVLFRRAGAHRLESAALSNLGVVAVALTEYEEALGYYHRALLIDRKIGSRAALAAKLAHVGEAYVHLGDLERAERYLERALTVQRVLGDRAQDAATLVTLGRLALRRRDLARARELGERGLARAVASSDRYQEIRALVYLALTCLALGDAEPGALELARRTTALSEESRIPQGLAWGLVLEGLALASAGRPDEGARRSASAADLLESGPHVQDRDEILYLHARVLRAAGRPAEAARAIRRAHAELEDKLARIRLPERRARYLGSSPAREIAGELAGLEK
jgi:predicted ATPase/class 3 adenylate cyclase